MECRLCLDSEPSVELFGRPDPLVMNIWNCCQIEVKKGDGLPEKICSMCEMTLSLFVQFRKSCENANKTLSERLYNSFNRTKLTEQELDIEIVENKVKIPTDILNADNKIFLDKKIIESDEKETVSDDAENTDDDVSYYEFNNDRESITDRNLSEVEIDFKDTSCNGKISERDAVDFDSSHNKILTCVCDETFSSRKLLKTHVEKSHTNLIDFKNHCEILKPSKSSANEISSGPKAQRLSKMSRICLKCKKTLANGDSFRLHLLRTHFDSVLNDLKQLKKANGNTLQNILETKLQEKRRKPNIKCSICDKKIMKRKFKAHVLQNHYDIMHDVDFNEQKDGQTNDKVLKIILSKASRKPKPKIIPQECDICGKMVSQIGTHKKRHMRIEGGFVCDICHKSYKNPVALYNHKMLIHDDPQNRVPCNVCGKMYKKRQFKMHMITHSTNTRFECDYCGKKFKYKNALEGHIASHLGLRPHTCQICYRSFTLKQTLKYHMFQHTGENPFKCKLCPREFKQRCNLKSHMRHFHKEKQ